MKNGQVNVTVDPKTLHRLACESTVDGKAPSSGVGRLLMPELHETLSNQLTAEQVIASWNSRYKKHTIEQKTSNVLLIYWGGKKRVCEVRKSQVYSDNPAVSPVNLELNEFAADKTNIFNGSRYKDPNEFEANKPDEDNIIW